MAAGWLYDGTSGVRHAVEVMPGGGALTLLHDGEPLETIEAADLITLDHGSTALTLGHRTIDGWRLRIAAPLSPAIETLFPRRGGYGHWIDRIGLWRATAVCAAVSGVLIGLGYIAPTLLAPLVPASVERAYGEALVGNFGGKFCSTPAGDRALALLTARLAPNADDIHVRVVDVPLVNAAALPAGNIVLFNPILSTVSGPDELAGILAHEIAHVRRHHVTAALIRQLGFGLLTSAIGGTTAGNVDSFVALSFTRRAEGEADATAIDMLNRAVIAPAATARFFRRMSAGEGDWKRLEPAMVYLSSHPLSQDRARKFITGTREGAAYTAALGATEWAALKEICGKRANK